jgi:hypothetical protein
MANNPEMVFLASSARVGELRAEGFDLSKQVEVTHVFTSLGDDVALRKALQEQGFLVSERPEVPGLEARRREILSSSNLKAASEQLCRTADKYAAEYDGWDLTARANRLSLRSDA